MTQQTGNYVFLLGRGRSGTTWIGRVLNVEPGYIYKYEPLNDYKNSPYSEWTSALKVAPDADLRAEFEKIVCTCQHEIDLPPFIQKTYRPQSRLLLRTSWQLGKLVPALKRIYEWYGRPRFDGAPSILLKQVNFPNEILADVTRVLSPRILGVVRNPFSSVSSALKYYRDRAEDPRSPEAFARVRELLKLPGYESMSHYTEPMERMSAATFETVRWRIQTEPLVAFLKTYHSAYMVIYERVAESPMEEFEKIYSFLEWQYSDYVKDFIASTTAAKTSRRPARQEFSVHRHAKESLTKWRKNLSNDEKADVLAVFSHSPLKSVWPRLLEAVGSDT